MFAKPMGLVVRALKQIQWVDFLFYFIRAAFSYGEPEDRFQWNWVGNGQRGFY